MQYGVGPRPRFFTGSLGEALVPHTMRPTRARDAAATDPHTHERRCASRLLGTRTTTIPWKCECDSCSGRGWSHTPGYSVCECVASQPHVEGIRFGGKKMKAIGSGDDRRRRGQCVGASKAAAAWAGLSSASSAASSSSASWAMWRRGAICARPGMAALAAPGQLLWGVARAPPRHAIHRFVRGVAGATPQGALCVEQRLKPQLDAS